MVKAKRLVRGKSGCSCTMPGVWRAVAHNEGAAVIFHSPQACAHIGQEMELASYYRGLSRGQPPFRGYTAPLIASGLKEEHAIFGGSDQLLHCIFHVAARYKPQYIIVANSCVAGVIGDDTEAVALQAEAELHIPVVAIPCHGFLDGDYYSGFYHAAKTLADRFMSPLPKRENAVALLGDCGGPGGEDTKEIELLLAYFGLEVFCHFPVYSSLEDIRKLPAAVLSVPLSGGGSGYRWLRRLGKELESAYGTNFFDSPFPVGWQATWQWLYKLGELLDREQAAALAVANEESRLRTESILYRAVLRGKMAVLCIGRPLLYFEPDKVFEILALGGVYPSAVILLDELAGSQRTAMLQAIENLTKAPVLSSQEGQPVLRSADVVITTHELADVPARQLFLPLLPSAGVGGILAFLRKLARLVMRRGSRGGMVYV